MVIAMDLPYVAFFWSSAQKKRTSSAVCRIFSEHSRRIWLFTHKSVSVKFISESEAKLPCPLLLSLSTAANNCNSVDPYGREISGKLAVIHHCIYGINLLYPQSRRPVWDSICTSRRKRWVNFFPGFESAVQGGSKMAFRSLHHLPHHVH